MINVKRFILAIALLSFCNFPALSTLTNNEEESVTHGVQIRLTKQDEEHITECVGTSTGNQHKYNSLYQSSARHERYLVFNFLSYATKGLAGLTSAGAGLTYLLPDEDKNIASGVLSFSTIGLITLDGIWQYFTKHYAESPEKLEQFLESEASKHYPRAAMDDIEKAQVRNIVRKAYEARRKGKERDSLLEEGIQ